MEEVKAADRILREANFPAWNIRASSKATISAAARRRLRDRGIHRQYCAEDSRGHRQANRPYLRAALSQDVMARLGYLFARRAFRPADKLDPRQPVTAACFSALTALSSRATGRRRRWLRGRRRNRLRNGPARLLGKYVDRSRFAKGRAQLDAAAATGRGERADRSMLKVPTCTASLGGHGSWLGYLPERRLTNAELATVVDTSDEWIVQRTGIRKRYIAGEGETTSILQPAPPGGACRRGLEPRRSISSSSRPRRPTIRFPLTRPRFRRSSASRKGAAFDLQAVCSGFVYRARDGRHVSCLGLASSARSSSARKPFRVSRLERSLDLRAVWRRRGRDGARSPEEAGASRRRGVLIAFAL